MANLTITVDDVVLRTARIRAVTMGTSVNAILREYLVSFAGAGQPQAAAATRLLSIAERAGKGRIERPIARDELHRRGGAR
ncbi:MAG: hypothetical protein U0575_14490 [Phycisphaerales bacterium]